MTDVRNWSFQNQWYRSGIDAVLTGQPVSRPGSMLTARSYTGVFGLRHLISISFILFWQHCSYLFPVGSITAHRLSPSNPIVSICGVLRDDQFHRVNGGASGGRRLSTDTNKMKIAS